MGTRLMTAPAAIATPEMGSTLAVYVTDYNGRVQKGTLTGDRWSWEKAGSPDDCVVGAPAAVMVDGDGRSEELDAVAVDRDGTWWRHASEAPGAAGRDSGF